VMTTQPRRYMAYLVRLWQVTSAGRLVWRASLEDPHTGERRGFADLETLFDFLKERTQANAEPEHGHAARRCQNLDERKPNLDT
jgi:hypothetical protein